MVNIENLKLQVSVDENQVSYVKVGEEVKVIPSVGGNIIEGKIAFVAPKSNGALKFPVDVLVSNKNKELKAGMYAKVQFSSQNATDNAQTLIVPRTAFVGSVSQNKIFKIVNGKQQGLMLIERNYKTPGRGGGEIDAIMRAADGTLVFVEVRLRTGKAHGGAAASVHGVKQRRIIHAAQHYVQQLPRMPACRFDVMACEQPGPPWHWTWLIAAFDAA